MYNILEYKNKKAYQDDHVSKCYKSFSYGKFTENIYDIFEDDALEGCIENIKLRYRGMPWNSWLQQRKGIDLFSEGVSVVSLNTGRVWKFVEIPYISKTYNVIDVAMHIVEYAFEIDQKITFQELTVTLLWIKAYYAFYGFDIIKEDFYAYLHCPYCKELNEVIFEMNIDIRVAMGLYEDENGKHFRYFGFPKYGPKQYYHEIQDIHDQKTFEKIFECVHLLGDSCFYKISVIKKHFSEKSALNYSALKILYEQNKCDIETEMNVITKVLKNTL